MQLLHCCLLFFLLALDVFAARSSSKCKVKCQRVKHTLDLNIFSIDLKGVSVDVGKCSRVEISENCSSIANNTDPCAEKQCTVRSHTLWTSSSRKGKIISVPVVKSCFPTWHHCQENCTRKPNIFYVFPESKYQTRVDLGKCTGNCKDGEQCLAVSTKSVSVLGPNGAVLMETIENCNSVNPGCYRTDYYESYWDYGNGTDRSSRENKVINVGKCIGQCPGVTTPGLCVPSDDDCQLYVGVGPAKCAPTRTETNPYTDYKGDQHTVASIEECGCGRG